MKDYIKSCNINMILLYNNYIMFILYNAYININYINVNY